MSYHSGNPSHAGKSKRYLTGAGELQQLMLSEHVSVSKADTADEGFKVRWNRDDVPVQHLRLSELVKSGQVFADNDGLYTLPGETMVQNSLPF